ncbi:hypothetical protein, partial [Halopseudomonas sp.]|uniref:hypothetical protein n=1 Tax=Halopseudomonas sp. TaxID=2901191 RepID=UPI00311E249F
RWRLDLNQTASAKPGAVQAAPLEQIQGVAGRQDLIPADPAAVAERKGRLTFTACSTALLAGRPPGECWNKQEKAKQILYTEAILYRIS